MLILIINYLSGVAFPFMFLSVLTVTVPAGIKQQNEFLFLHLTPLASLNSFPSRLCPHLRPGVLQRVWGQFTVRKVAQP